MKNTQDGVTDKKIRNHGPLAIAFLRYRQNMQHLWGVKAEACIVRLLTKQIEGGRFSNIRPPIPKVGVYKQLRRRLLCCLPSICYARKAFANSSRLHSRDDSEIDTYPALRHRSGTIV